MLLNNLITPDNVWNATIGDNNKTLSIWGSDYDGYICSFKPEDDIYYLVVPAGIVKNAAGDTNEQIVIMFIGTQQIAGINNVVSSKDTTIMRLS